MTKKDAKTLKIGEKVRVTKDIPHQGYVRTKLPRLKKGLVGKVVEVSQIPMDWDNWAWSNPLNVVFDFGGFGGEYCISPNEIERV